MTSRDEPYHHIRIETQKYRKNTIWSARCSACNWESEPTSNRSFVMSDAKQHQPNFRDPDEQRLRDLHAPAKPVSNW